MTHVATLVTPDDRPVLDDAVLTRAASLLPNASAPEWLAPGIAVDVAFVPAGAMAQSPTSSQLGGPPSGNPDRAVGLGEDGRAHGRPAFAGGTEVVVGERRRPPGASSEGDDLDVRTGPDVAVAAPVLIGEVVDGRHRQLVALACVSAVEGGAHLHI